MPFYQCRRRLLPLRSIILCCLFTTHPISGGWCFAFFFRFSLVLLPIILCRPGMNFPGWKPFLSENGMLVSQTCETWYVTLLILAALGCCKICVVFNVSDIQNRSQAFVSPELCNSTVCTMQKETQKYFCASKRIFQLHILFKHVHEGWNEQMKFCSRQTLTHWHNACILIAVLDQLFVFLYVFVCLSKFRKKTQYETGRIYKPKMHTEIPPRHTHTHTYIHKQSHTHLSYFMKFHYT